MAEPNFTGVEVEVPKTPFVDANQQTIMNTKGSNRIGLGDFTRNDGAASPAGYTAACGGVGDYMACVCVWCVTQGGQ